MTRTAMSIAGFALLGALSAPCSAEDSRWGSLDEPVVKFMIVSEAKWAESECSPQSDLTTFIADDFQGTSTQGKRYPKATAVADDPATASRDCRMGSDE